LTFTVLGEKIARDHSFWYNISRQTETKYQGGSLVNNIIQHICENFISEVLNFFDAGTIRKLDEMETVLKEKANCFLRR